MFFENEIHLFKLRCNWFFLPINYICLSNLNHLSLSSLNHHLPSKSQDEQQFDTVNKYMKFKFNVTK